MFFCIITFSAKLLFIMKAQCTIRKLKGILSWFEHIWEYLGVGVGRTDQRYYWEFPYCLNSVPTLCQQEGIYSIGPFCSARHFLLIRSIPVSIRSWLNILNEGSFKVHSGYKGVFFSSFRDHFLDLVFICRL